MTALELTLMQKEVEEEEFFSTAKIFQSVDLLKNLLTEFINKE